MDGPSRKIYRYFLRRRPQGSTGSNDYSVLAIAATAFLYYSYYSDDKFWIANAAMNGVWNLCFYNYCFGSSRWIILSKLIGEHDYKYRFDWLTRIYTCRKMYGICNRRFDNMKRIVWTSRYMCLHKFYNL